MANGFRARIINAVSDGTNIFLDIETSSATRTHPLLTVQFKVGTTAATILAYLQTIADNGGVVADDVRAICGQYVQGA